MGFGIRDIQRIPLEIYVPNLFFLIAFACKSTSNGLHDIALYFQSQILLVAFKGLQVCDRSQENLCFKLFHMCFCQRKKTRLNRLNSHISSTSTTMYKSQPCCSKWSLYFNIMMTYTILHTHYEYHNIGLGEISMDYIFHQQVAWFHINIPSRYSQFAISMSVFNQYIWQHMCVMLSTNDMTAHINTPKPWKIWHPFCRRHFQVNFREWKW